MQSCCECEVAPGGLNSEVEENCCTSQSVVFIGVHLNSIGKACIGHFASYYTEIASHKVRAEEI